MLVYDPKDKTWKCESPSDEEVQELLEIGKTAVVKGFGAQFMANLIEAGINQDEDPEEPIYDPKLN